VALADRLTMPHATSITLNFKRTTTSQWFHHIASFVAITEDTEVILSRRSEDLFAESEVETNE
jgi:hypothetical protein